MVPLGEQQFQDHAAVFPQPFAVGFDVHALGDFGGAGGQQFRHAGDFHDAQAARAQVINALQMAERGDVDPRLGRGLQHGRAFLGGDLLAVNGQSFGSHK